jgi:peptidoglycan/LPS O-acetylase OafA/YrhL
MRTVRSADRPAPSREPVEVVTAVDTSEPVEREREFAGAPTERYGREWLRERVDGRVALAVGVAWFVLFQIAMLLEPATSHTVPVVGVVLEIVMWTLLATMIAGLIAQRRWGFAGSLAAAVFATAGSIACPTTGHHPFGAWWFGQMVCVIALVAVSATALLRAPKLD